MDDNFICARLKKWAALLHGDEDSCYARVKNGKYIFGNDENKNILTKPFALYLVAGQVKSPDTPPIKKPKKKIKRRRKYD